MGDGLRCALRESGRTVGAGIVTKILDQYLFEDNMMALSERLLFVLKKLAIGHY